MRLIHYPPSNPSNEIEERDIKTNDDDSMPYGVGEHCDYGNGYFLDHSSIEKHALLHSLSNQQ